MAVSGFISTPGAALRLRATVRAKLRPRRRLRPLRRWFLASVRARTTVLSMLVVAAAVAACAISLTVIVSRSLVRNVDETNLTRAEDVGARARAGALGRVIPVSGGASDKSVFIQVVDQAGSVVASSENYLDTNAFIYVYPEEGSHHRILFQRTVKGPPLAPKASFRVIVLTGQTPTGPANVIVATEMAQAEETVAELRRALAYGAPGVLVLAGLLVWLLVGRALRPVEVIRSQVASITDTASLDRRVGESPVDDEVGRLAQTMNAMLDRLQRSAERQRRFVADASHELRSPLASSRAQLEVALSHPDTSTWEATAVDLLSENQRMERLVNDLLFLARSEARPAGLAGATPLDLDDIVLHEAGRLRSRGRVQVDISRVSAGRVRGVGDHLTRVVRNLVENAERYAAGTIWLELRRVGAGGRGPQVQLVVSDDGPGVPTEHREHIFDRFIRLDDARSRPDGENGGGSGLGLAICREIVTAHGGRIWAEATQAGGARFVVQFPADSGESPTSPTAS
ncbi:MAG TPA: ATP-binding protein [Acidimicrobiia bacterium]